MKLYLRKRARPKGQRQSPLAQFPPELLERIITHFMRDPCTTFDQLKSLRLVCRSFNHVVARRVLSCIRLFGSADNPVSNIHRLHAMFSSNQIGHLHLTKTLVLSWKWRYEYLSVFKSFRTMRISNEWVCGMAWNSTLAPLVYLLVALFVPRFLPLSACDFVARLHARYRLSQASVLNTMPNVRRVIWVSKGNSGLDRMVSGTVKLLLRFHQLSELVLVMDYKQDLKHIFECFSKLHNLRKLRIEARPLTYPNLPNPDVINDLGKILGANLNLTHFELVHPGVRSGMSFPAIFGHIPASSPLKLEHLDIHNTGFPESNTDIRAIIPHIRSLTSIHLAYPLHVGLIRLLHSERIFPPIIRTTLFYNQPITELIHYLNDHPGIISFSVPRACFADPLRSWTSLLEIMARHSKSLTHFSTEIMTFSLSRRLWNVQNELLFLQCTKLERLVLNPSFGFHCEDYVIEVLPIIAQLSSSLTLVIAHDKAFKACIKHCRQSQNPLIYDLAGRIVCEEPKQSYD